MGNKWWGELLGEKQVPITYPYYFYPERCWDGTHFFWGGVKVYTSMEPWAMRRWDPHPQWLLHTCPLKEGLLAKFGS